MMVAAIVPPGSACGAAEDVQEARTEPGIFMSALPQLVGSLSPALSLAKRGALLEPVVDLEEPVRKIAQQLLKLRRLANSILFHSACCTSALVAPSRPDWLIG